MLTSIPVLPTRYIEGNRGLLAEGYSGREATNQPRITVSAACQMFMVPASMLFVALAVATTEELKALLAASVLGISILFFVRVWIWRRLLLIAEQRDAVPFLGIRQIRESAFCYRASGSTWNKSTAFIAAS